MDFFEDLRWFCRICKRHYREEEHEFHRHHKVRALYISEKGAHKMIDGILVGATRTFTATTVPSGSTFASGVVPKWTSSDVTVATVVDPNPDATGLTAQVTGVAAGSFTLTAAATLPDNSVVQGSAQVPVMAAEPQSLVIDEVPAS